MKLAALAVLSDADIRQIHDATLSILEDCGLVILSPSMLGFLKGAGFPVDEARQLVRFPRGRVEDALASVPPRIDVYDREGEPAFTLGDGTPRVAAGHNAVFWVDSDSGQTRPSTVADVEACARICDQLAEIDMIGIPVMPQDVPCARATLPFAVRAVMQNSRKPVFFSTDMPSANRACIELARAAFMGDLSHQAYAIAQLSPTSPLYWEKPVLEALVDTIEAGVPLAILPEPNAGVSAPYTLAGLLTVNNAECLSGIVMSQVVRRGAAVLYANSWTATDMRTGAALVGSAETTVCRIAGAQLARHYRIPSHTTAPNSDNHAHDEQNAWEKTLSQFCALGAGNDLAVNCGMFATGMTFSHEQLVMDAEISALCRRVADGTAVEPETIAADLIRSIGPRGEGYLTSEHTFRWLRTREYTTPLVAVRGPRTSWEAAGSQDAYQIARERARVLMAGAGSVLDVSRARALDEVVDTFAHSLAD
jgi:trimethylamine---corrinoid protein Co-methyltransferase